MSIRRQLIEQLRNNTELLIELKKSFSNSELETWWRDSIKESRKLLRKLEA